MLIVGDPQNKSLSESIAKELSADLIYPEITVFPDTETRIRLSQEKVAGQKVYIIKSCEMPVDSSVLEFSFMTDAAIRAGADKVIGIIPYLPYMRADHVFRPGEAVPLEIVIKIIEASGVNEILIFDPHSIKIPEMFKIDIKNLSALHVFAEKIAEIEPDKSNITIVSPDMGALRRLEILAEFLGGNINSVYINKDRDYESGNVSVAEYKGEIRGKCFIVDDIISTGKTIVQAVETLVNNGAGEVYVFATHPVFSEDAGQLLQNSGLKKVYVTDSIPVGSGKMFEKLEILSLSGLIAESILG